MGKIELDHTGSGGGITLSSDGTDLLLDGTAIGGGGGAALYDANESSPTSQPNAVGANAIAIGEGATANGSESFAFGDQSVAGTTGGNNFALAMGYRATASGAFSACFSPYNGDATAQHSAAFGSYAQAAGTGSVSLGKSYASGTDSLAAAITNNTSSYGATNTKAIAIGNLAKASGSFNSLALSTSQALASGQGSIAIGDTVTASGLKSIAIGQSATASKTGSIALGRYVKSEVQGKLAYTGDFIGAIGDAQYGLHVLNKGTTDATATVITTNGSVAGTDNQVNVPTNAAFAFHGTIVAKQSGSANAAAWKVEGLIVNNGGTTTLTNSATTVLSNTPSWGMALSADNTNNALAITVTGAAATNIRWVATIHTSEVTYA